MQQPVEQRGDGGGVAEQLSPVVDGSIRGEHRGGPLVTTHDQLEQVLGGGMRQLAHAEVVDDEQGHAGQIGQIVLARLGERRLGELLEEGVGFAVDDAVALLNRGAADGLCEMALAGTWRPEVGLRVFTGQGAQIDTTTTLCRELGINPVTLYRYVGPQGQLREQGEKVLAT